MPRESIAVGQKPQGPAHFSAGIAIEAHGKLVFVSAMTARRSDGQVVGVGDVAAQTRQVCENIKAVLQAAGGTLKDVCQVTVYLRHMSDRERVNAVRREFFGSPPPASTLVEVTKLASPEFLIEISAVALVPSPAGASPSSP